MIIGEQVLEELGTGPAHLARGWLPSGGRLLEIGCSSGYLTRHFLGRAESMFGLDINPAALASARRRHPHLRVVCGDVERLPFADGSFDVIVMLEVIEHTRSDAAAVAEIRRVLTVGGTLILSTPHTGIFAFLDPYNLRRALQRRFPSAYAAVGWLVRFESGQFTANVDRHRHYGLDELVALLGGDFMIRAVYRGGLILFPLVAAAISVAGRLWNSPSILRPLLRVLNWDFHCRFGRLSYNVMVLARKTR
jgi:SAM-dependent methyltransferase